MYNNKLAMVSGVSIVIVLILILSIAFVNYSKVNLYVALINGEGIAKKQFKRVMGNNRAEIYRYFKIKYNVDDNKDFWLKSYNGEVPIKIAREKTLNECVKIKIQQILAREKGLVKDINYKAFLKNLVQENKRREQAITNKQIIYGPIEFNENEYFEYVFSNMVIELKRELGKKEIFFNNEKLKTYYDSIKDKLYKKQDNIKIIKISVLYVKDNENADKIKKEIALSKIKEIKKRLDKGENFEKLAEIYNGDVQFSEQTFEESSARMNSKLNEKLYKEVYELKKGDISNIIEEDNSFYIMKCVEKEQTGYYTFEQVKDNVKQKYIDEKYQQLINNLMNKAKIKINERVYKNMMIREKGGRF